MRKALITAYAAILILLLTCCAAYDPVHRTGESRYKSIVVIGIDGGGGLFKSGDALTEEFSAFFSTDDSSKGFTYSCETPSISAQNWGSYLHGVQPGKLEVNNLKISSVRFTDMRYPSVFQVIHDVDPSCTLASICHWNPINYGLIETTAGVYKNTDLRFRFENYSDAETVSHVLDYLKDNTPSLLFVHLDDTDETGHSRGYGSPEYMEEERRAQEHCLEIFSCFDPETTLFIVITDHGGTPDGEHGGDTPDEMHITFAIRGKGLNAGALDNFAFMPRDLAPIILTAMNIEVPSCMEGTCPSGLFSN